MSKMKTDKSNNINIKQNSKKNIQNSIKLHGDSIFCSPEDSFLRQYYKYYGYRGWQC